VAGPEIYVVSRGLGAEAQALQLARRLRLAGRTVELDQSGSAFGKQFKRADRSGAPWAVVIGEGEWEQGLVLLKALRAEAAGGQSEQRLTPAALLERFV